MSEHIPSKTLRKLIMDDGGWFPSSYAMKSSIGRDEADVLMKHLDFQIRYKSGYNHKVRGIIKFEMGLSARKQKSIEDKLVEFGFMSIEKSGRAHMNVYTIHIDRVTSFQQRLHDGGIAYIHQCRCAGYIPYKQRQKATESDTSAVNAIRRSAETAERNPIQHGGRSAVCADNIKNSKREDKSSLDVSSNRDTVVPKKKSRLKPKDGVEPVKKSRLKDKGEVPDLATMTNRSGGGNRTVSDKAIQCVDHWNTYPELVSHKIDIDNPSKTLLHISMLLGRMFNGTFLDTVTAPHGFKDHDWFKNRVTVDEFCDIVDDFIYCIRSPDVKPTGNGYRYNLVSFLQGNQYVKDGNGGTDSLMLVYCFGEYKTVIKNQYPKCTEKIKDMWMQYIGKFTDTPGSERAFVMASNLCNARFAQKRKEEEGWIPAMNDYKPYGIIRQILIDKAEWFKKEKKAPEIMGSSFFTNTIRRYDYNKATGDKTL